MPWLRPYKKTHHRFKHEVIIGYYFSLISIHIFALKLELNNCILHRE